MRTSFSSPEIRSSRKNDFIAKLDAKYGPSLSGKRELLAFKSELKLKNTKDDAVWRVLSQRCNVAIAGEDCTNLAETILQTMLQFYEMRAEDMTFRLQLLLLEITRTAQAPLLLRGSSAFIFILRKEFTNGGGIFFIKKCLRPFFSSKKMTTNLLELTLQAVKKMNQHVLYFPAKVRLILDRFQQEAKKKFGDELKQDVVCTFVFLRLISPVTVAPESLITKKKCSADLKQRLIQCSKIFMDLACEQKERCVERFRNEGPATMDKIDEIEHEMKAFIGLLLDRKQLIKISEKVVRKMQATKTKFRAQPEAQLGLVKKLQNDYAAHFDLIPKKKKVLTNDDILCMRLKTSVIYSVNRSARTQLQMYSPGSLSPRASKEFARDIRASMKRDLPFCREHVMTHKPAELLGATYCLCREILSIHHSVYTETKAIIISCISHKFSRGSKPDDVFRCTPSQTKSSISAYLEFQKIIPRNSTVADVLSHDRRARRIAKWCLLSPSQLARKSRPFDEEDNPEIFSLVVLFSYFGMLRRFTKESVDDILPHDSGFYDVTTPGRKKPAGEALKYAIKAVGKESVYDLLQGIVPEPSPTVDSWEGLSNGNSNCLPIRLPQKFKWAKHNPFLGQALARWHLAQETLSKQMLSPAVLMLLKRVVRQWNGKRVDEDWIESRVSVLRNEFETQLSTICLETAFIAEEINPARLKAFQAVVGALFPSKLANDILFAGVSFTCFLVSKKILSFVLGESGPAPEKHKLRKNKSHSLFI
eukprot:TRINITY_DN5203_c0_g1_i1.p1 TRINITY_DN5203_c0_g1~~TRINITY_DN5203_c0_g1_i1.p1  ORF type:complete len:760 (-),score=88.69 TRINITY_DN5203_c0_g1_i1:267-2546(-)